MNKNIQIVYSSGVATTFGLAAATSIAMSQTQIAVHPPGPEPAYHLAHDHHDLLGLVPMGMGLGALYGTFRVALHIRDIL